MGLDENWIGRVKSMADVTNAVKPGVVHEHHGWWMPEDDGEEPNLFSFRTYNINAIMPHKVIGKLGFGNTFKCSLCKIYRVTDE